MGIELQKTGSTKASKGYKEKHDLVMMDGSNESHNGDQQQKEAHGNHAADDVDAGGLCQSLSPMLLRQSTGDPPAEDEKKTNQKCVATLQYIRLYENAILC